MSHRSSELFKAVFGDEYPRCSRCLFPLTIVEMAAQRDNATPAVCNECFCAGGTGKERSVAA